MGMGALEVLKTNGETLTVTGPDGTPIKIKRVITRDGREIDFTTSTEKEYNKTFNKWFPEEGELNPEIFSRLPRMIAQEILVSVILEQVRTAVYTTVSDYFKTETYNVVNFCPLRTAKFISLKIIDRFDIDDSELSVAYNQVESDPMFFEVFPFWVRQKFYDYFFHNKDITSDFLFYADSHKKILEPFLEKRLKVYDISNKEPKENPKYKF